MMSKFDFLFGCTVGKTLLNQTDNLSQTLQNPKLSALEAQTIARNTVTTLKKTARRMHSIRFGILSPSVKNGCPLTIQSYHESGNFLRAMTNFTIISNFRINQGPMQSYLLRVY